jgi:hypothetical protein
VFRKEAKYMDISVIDSHGSNMSGLWKQEFDVFEVYFST